MNSPQTLAHVVVSVAAAKALTAHLPLAACIGVAFDEERERFLRDCESLGVDTAVQAQELAAVRLCLSSLGLPV